MYIIHEASNVIFVDQPKLVSEHLRIFSQKQDIFQSIKERSCLPYLEELDNHLCSDESSSNLPLTIDFLHQFNIMYNFQKSKGNGIVEKQRKS